MSENISESRPRRLHWITLLVLLLMASSLGIWQVRGVSASVPASDGPRTRWDVEVWQFVWQHGWPVSYLTVFKYSQWNLTNGVKAFRLAALALDVAVCFGLLGFTTVAVEQFVRRRRLQFGIRSLFVLTAIAAVAVALQARGMIEWEHILVLFGFACFMGVMGRLVLRCVRRNRRTQPGHRTCAASPAAPINVF